MVKNNIELDVKVKCIEQGKTQAQVAKEINTFVKMMEALGFDIELHYVKREE